MTVQDILDTLETEGTYPGDIKSQVKEKMPDYEVAVYDDDTDLGDSYTTTSVVTTFIQNCAQGEILEDIDIGNIWCTDDYGQHTYTVIAVKTD